MPAPPPQVLHNVVLVGTDYTASCPACRRDVTWWGQLAGTTTDGTFEPALAVTLQVRCDCADVPS